MRKIIHHKAARAQSQAVYIMIEKQSHIIIQLGHNQN